MQFEFGGIRYNLLDTPGPPGLQRGHLPHADRGRLRDHADRRRQGRRDADAQAVRGLPHARHADRHVREQARPAGARSARADERGRGGARLRTAPVTWPIGSGDRFQGVYDRAHRQRAALRAHRRGTPPRCRSRSAASTTRRSTSCSATSRSRTLRDEIELLDGAGEQYDQQRFLRGEITPVFFGSALTNFGVEPFLDAFADMCPPPGPHDELGRRDRSPRTSASAASCSRCRPTWTRRTAIASRSCACARASSAAACACTTPGSARRSAWRSAEQLMAQERQAIDEAYAGDIIGLFDPGLFRIGDTLSHRRAAARSRRCRASRPSTSRACACSIR